MLTVQKFGGSSLAGPEGLRRAAAIISRARREGQAVIAVVSAMGDTTDDLLALARELAPEPPKRELDALLGTGEQQSAALLAITLESLGEPARSLSGAQAGIFADGVHGDGRISLMFPRRLLETLDEGRAAVVCGFQGLDAEGDLITLGRGGSDTSAVAIAAALHADRCEIYTDVEGIYTADPRVLPEARRLSAIDYEDMLRLAEAGSQVLHDRSVRLAMAQGVEIILRTRRPCPGWCWRWPERDCRCSAAHSARASCACCCRRNGWTRARRSATACFWRSPTDCKMPGSVLSCE